MLRAYELENTVKKKKKPMKNQKPAPKRRPARASTPSGSTPSRKPGVRARPSDPVRESEVIEVEPEAAPIVEPAADSTILITNPEPHFVTRVLPPEPERPTPTARRAIFFDVENASRPEHIARVIDHLEVDRTGRRTDFVAVGNWRVIGHDTARLLARHGAHLVHSAPSVGVRDWSDLRIAVAAGVWLAGGRAGDVLEIVTNDRAFDAVGDVAASLGIAFRRLSHQGLSGSAAEPRAPVREAPADRSRRYGRGRRRGSWRERSTAGSGAATIAPVPVPAESRVVAPEPPPAAAAAEVEGSPHTAPHDEIIAVVHELMQRSTGRPLTLDTLANALKARGFSRPPGSPRLITRLRRIKEIELSRSGVITLVNSHEPARPAEEAPPAEDALLGAEEPVAVEPDVDTFDVDAGPEPGNEALPVSAPAPSASRRRRSRRGGRGRRHLPEPAPAA